LKANIDKVCIVVSDATRPVPSNLILKALLQELLEAGVNFSQIIILIATGLHRGSKKDELHRIIGTDLLKKLNVINHDAERKEDMKFFTDPLTKQIIGINKNYVNADLKILTGYVEPHFFFGFSGGRKSLVPGISYRDTILYNHSAEKIASPNARFGISKENPLSENANRITEIVGVDFTVNVCINENHNITKISAGNWSEVHKELVEYQNKYVFHEFNKKYDIVICGNGGYPLDLNMYQAVKIMAIGEMIIKEGGTIIAVNELSEGIGIGQDNFKDMIFSGKEPNQIHSEILSGKINLPDQWEIQVLTRILMKSNIMIISELNEKQLGNIGLQFAKDVESAVKQCVYKYGNDASILVIPHGPQILPIFITQKQ
jgi:nickel-dependent lactate racemase